MLLYFVAKLIRITISVIAKQHSILLIGNFYIYIHRMSLEHFLFPIQVFNTGDFSIHSSVRVQYYIVVSAFVRHFQPITAGFTTPQSIMVLQYA